jgi:hypothetical protein
MTTPADHPSDESNDDASPDFAIATPFGIFTDADDLPPQLRDALLRAVETNEIPDELRAILRTVLNADATTSSDEAAVGPHGPGCTCEKSHREQLWNLLDAAFPDDPHLWQAAESLFTLSAHNPAELDEESRRASIELATLHLQRHADLTAPAETPIDQIVTKFRREMDGM